MTIHASKGLEFEAVVLVDIDARPGNHGTPILHNPDGTFHIVPSKEQASLMGLDDLVQRKLREDFMEELSVLYVAMTRARSFLDIVLRADGNMPVATLLRAALLPVGEDGITEQFEGVSFRASQEARAESQTTRCDTDPGVAADVPPENPPLASAFRRTVHITPSSTNEPTSVSITRILLPANRAAMRRGELIHEWLRQITWIEDGLPDAETWIASAAETARDVDRRDIARWAQELIKEARTPDTELHRTFSRPGAAPDEAIELWRERRFAVVHEAAGRNEVISGSFDRVVLWRDAKGRAVRAEITDFKTDRFDSPQERAQIEARYAPQLDAYRKALCLLCPGLDSGAVAISLAFVKIGEQGHAE
jgi:ATP-dependent helicase/nuclease subunit A